MDLRKEFETAAVNEPSVFEPLKFYCSWISQSSHSHGSKETPQCALYCKKQYN